jgi:hypothetical protein
VATAAASTIVNLPIASPSVGRNLGSAR